MTSGQFDSNYEDVRRIVRRLVFDEWSRIIGLLERMLQEREGQTPKALETRLALGDCPVEPSAPQRSESRYGPGGNVLVRSMPWVRPCELPTAVVLAEAMPHLDPHRR